MKRYYYRCPICLSVQALEIEDLIKVKCSICNIEMKSMGFVHEESLVEVELRSPCDLRCTQAFGPKCDCKCQGKNHGSFLIVETIKVVGDIPKIPIRDPFAYFRRKEFLEASERAEKRCEIRGTSYLQQGGEYEWKIRSLMQELMMARKMESHKPRLKKLNSLFV